MSEMTEQMDCIDTRFCCGVCGEVYYNADETTVTIRRVAFRRKAEAATTTIWEFHICDECLNVMKVVNE